MPRSEKIYLLLAATFVASLLIANIITFKLFSVPIPGELTIFGEDRFILAAGILPYPVTFLVTDLISELYGKRRADAVVWAGFLMSMYVLVVLRIGAWVPPVGTEARTPEEVQALYTGVFGQSSRAIIASMIAYLVAQLIDVRLFHFWKRVTGGKHLWLRNNASTVTSQLLDSVLVVSILFYAVLPLGTIVQIIIASYIFKFLIALTDTPFIYLAVAFLRPRLRGDPAYREPAAAGGG